MLFTLAACLWLPVSAHCQIESLTGLEFLQCGGSTLAETGACHDDEGQSACCPVEKSQYQTSQLRVAPPAPALLPVLLAAVLPAAEPPVTLLGAARLSTAPPHLPQTWLFVSRAALPVRAPSFAS